MLMGVLFTILDLTLPARERPVFIVLGTSDISEALTRLLEVVGVDGPATQPLMGYPIIGLGDPGVYYVDVVTDTNVARTIPLKLGDFNLGGMNN